MHGSKYMFIKYSKNFPVYVSVQNQGNNLVLPHFHEDLEILKVTRGKVIVLAGNKYLECSCGDILFFTPNTTHQVNAPAENSEIMAISYNDEVLKLSVDYSSQMGGFRIFRQFDECYCKLNETFLEAIDLFKNMDTTYQIEMTASLLKLTAILIKEKVAVISENGASKKRIAPALEFIEQNIDIPIKNSDLAKELNVSKDHLIRIFKSSTGKTPLEYILDLKIKKAMSYLSEDTCSLTEISEKLAFSNPSHFSKCFKSRLKMTPSEYRAKFVNPD